MDTVVIGASGLVGSNVVRRFREAGFDVVGTYNTSPTAEGTVHVDKTDESAVSAVISERDPDIVVDTAAFHDVDTCEFERDAAWSVNATGTRNAAVAADDANAQFVYLSTDYVFPGDPDQAPYAENDRVNPVNYYGQSKYAGEQAAKIATRSTILRSSVLYGTSNANFMTWALDQLRDDHEIEVVDDQVGTPTYAADVAEACLRVGRQDLTGLFHAAGPESVSRYEFTRRLAEVYGYDPDDVRPIPTENLGQQATRPRDSSLDSTRLYDRINYTFRGPRRSFESIRSRG